LEIQAQIILEGPKEALFLEYVILNNRTELKILSPLSPCPPSMLSAKQANSIEQVDGDKVAAATNLLDEAQAHMCEKKQESFQTIWWLWGE
jgi:hypothetical protein